MTKEELDEKILNRMPHARFLHYDGIMILATWFAFRRKKKREHVEKLRDMVEQDLYQSLKSSKYEENLHIV